MGGSFRANFGQIMDDVTPIETTIAISGLEAKQLVWRTQNQTICVVSVLNQSTVIYAVGIDAGGTQIIRDLKQGLKVLD